MKDEFGDRMKAYEAVGDTRLDVHLPICARIDGRSFSKFTRNYDRPFDARISHAMRATAAYLVEQTHARIGYVQSDEISLIYMAETPESSVFFDGRVQKLCSVLASMAAGKFMRELPDEPRIPSFDARVWQVPSRTEAANVLLWRAQDARKNAISMACRSMFSAAQMHGQGQADMLAMMESVGVDFHSAYPAEDRFGVFCQRKTELRELEDAVWDRIPERNRPDSRMVVRSRVVALDLGYFGGVMNREAVVFEGADPVFY